MTFKIAHFEEFSRFKYVFIIISSHLLKIFYSYIHSNSTIFIRRANLMVYRKRIYQE